MADDTTQPRPDPLTHGLHGGGGKDRRADYGNAPGVDGKEQVRAPDDIEDRVGEAEGHAVTVNVEQNPGRDA